MVTCTVEVIFLWVPAETFDMYVKKQNIVKYSIARNAYQLTICFCNVVPQTHPEKMLIIFIIKDELGTLSGCLRRVFLETLRDGFALQPGAVTTRRCLTTKMLMLLNLCLCVCARVSIGLVCVLAPGGKPLLPWMPEWARCTATAIYTQLLCS